MGLKKFNKAKGVMEDVPVEAPVPFSDTNVERAVLSCILENERVEYIFGNSDSSFFTGRNTEVFEEAFKQYKEHGSVRKGEVASRLSLAPEWMAERYSMKDRADLLDYYIPILKGLKVRRYIFGKAVELQSLVEYDNTPLEEVSRLCKDLHEYMTAVTGDWPKAREEKVRGEDWYVLAGNESATKYRVCPGKDGRSDYCWIDGKSVSEHAMLHNGYCRMRLPVEEKAEK